MKLRVTIDTDECNLDGVEPHVIQIDYEGVVKILKDAGIGIPSYYSWRSRSGCYFCFYQRPSEWVGLAENHPKLFIESMEYEKVRITDGENEIIWDGKNEYGKKVANGVYFCRLSLGGKYYWTKLAVIN